MYFFINLSFSQNSYEYVGAIKLNDSSLIKYQVKFTETKGIINGHSITDIGGLHETKSNLLGTYNADLKLLEFKEMDIIYTKSKVIQEDFCFVNFTSLKYKLGNSKINGSFQGLFSDNTECINGEIILNSKEKLTKRVKKVQRLISKTKKIPDSLKENFKMVNIMDSIQMNVLRTNQVMSVFSKSKKVRVEIYDGGKLDGDKITLKVNGEVLLSNFETTFKPKILNITLNDKKTSILLMANNVGSISTNTAVIEFFIDDQKIRALSNLKAKEFTQVDLYLKK